MTHDVQVHTLRLTPAQYRATLFALRDYIEMWQARIRDPAVVNRVKAARVALAKLTKAYGRNA